LLTTVAERDPWEQMATPTNRKNRVSHLGRSTPPVATFVPATPS
jgi:hypothetical protein